MVNCDAITGKEDDDNQTLVLALAAIASANSSCSASTSTTTSTVTPSTATLNDATGCVNGVVTCLDSNLPAWIKNNFTCVVGYVSGSNYVIKTKNLPNTKSYYYASRTGVTSAPLYEALPSGNSSAGTNVIIAQNLTFTIPATPTTGSGTVSTQGGLVAIGVTRNGLAIYNNAAAPGDVLASEATTFDNFQGHPQNTGVYHHHAAVPKVCDGAANTSNSGACNNAKLIGIALDGYPIYGQKNDAGVAPTLDSFHGTTGTTAEFPNGTYHYRYAYDSTATIYTLMGSFFRGNIGSVTNN
ncbi:YHYH protein [Leptospira ryugenii]|nr:YHYH protein [Leptospira ryugenii]